MKIVIKFAGALLEDPATVQTLAEQVASLAQKGHQILVVHGGGRIFTATLARLGIESKFVAGLRVTDRETRDVAGVGIVWHPHNQPSPAHVPARQTRARDL